MATVKIDTFHGIAPRQHPSLLADGMAVTAHNCKLENGKLVPIRMPERIGDSIVNLEAGLQRISDANSLFAWRNGEGLEFLAFGGVCDMADGNLADDEKFRVFITGETGLSWGGHDNVPAVYLKDGKDIIRHPITKDPLVRPYVKLGTPHAPTPEDPDNVMYTYFVQTWVDQFGYESPKSLTSLTWTGGTEYEDKPLEYNNGDPVEISALVDDEVPEGGGTVDEPTAGYRRRVYKVVTGSETGTMRFVAEFSGDDVWGAHTIRVRDEDAGEEIPAIDGIPYDLRNIAYVPGGFYVGFSPSNPRTVMFSDIGMPTSWPMAYRYDVGDDIVALAVSGNTVFALTNGYPYVLSGTAPESMSAAKLAGPAACVSKRSVCLYKSAVCYASNVGVCMIAPSADAGTTVNNLTEKIFTKDQWKAYGPGECLMAQHDGALFCFFGRESDGGLVIDLQESENAVTTHDEKSSCLCVDNATDELYFVRAKVGEV